MNNQTKWKCNECEMIFDSSDDSDNGDCESIKQYGKCGVCLDIDDVYQPSMEDPIRLVDPHELYEFCPDCGEEMGQNPSGYFCTNCDYETSG